MAQEYVLSLFARVFGVQPDQVLIEDLASKETKEALSVFLNGEELAEFAEFQDSLKVLLLEEDPFSRLVGEHLKGLEAPGEMIAYPWESVYAEGAPLLFQESTASVIESYRAAGFKLKLEANVPQDHISYELLFMALLSSEDRHEEFNLFKEEHLMKWVPEYCDDIQSLPDSEYLCASARTLKAFLNKI